MANEIGDTTIISRKVNLVSLFNSYTYKYTIFKRTSADFKFV